MIRLRDKITTWRNTGYFLGARMIIWHLMKKRDNEIYTYPCFHSYNLHKWYKYSIHVRMVNVSLNCNIFRTHDWHESLRRPIAMGWRPESYDVRRAFTSSSHSHELTNFFYSTCAGRKHKIVNFITSCPLP